MSIAKLCNKKYRRFTDEAEPVETVTREFYIGGILHIESYGGKHYFLRKPKPILEEYRRWGHPYGKTLRGLKRFATEAAHR